LLIVDDLFFLAKIQETAKLTGVPVEGMPLPKFQERLQQDPSQGRVRGVIIDLNHRTGLAVDLIRGMKSIPATSAVPIIGFLSHVQGDLAQAARSAGCDIVVARSAFTQQLPDLLRKLAGIGAPETQVREAEP